MTMCDGLACLTTGRTDSTQCQCVMAWLVLQRSKTDSTQCQCAMAWLVLQHAQTQWQWSTESVFCNNLWLSTFNLSGIDSAAVN